MNAAQILDALAEHGARVAVEGERVKVLHPAGRTPPPDLLAAARAHKAELRALMATVTVIAPSSPLESATASPGVPRTWLEGFDQLDPDRPAANYPGPDWRIMYRDAEAFLAGKWAGHAFALSWGDLDVWGVHRLKPLVRYDAAGIVAMIRGSRVVALTADEAVFQKPSGSHLRHTRFPPHPEAVLLWELPLQRPPRERTRT